MDVFLFLCRGRPVCLEATLVRGFGGFCKLARTRVEPLQAAMLHTLPDDLFNNQLSGGLEPLRRCAALLIV